MSAVAGKSLESIVCPLCSEYSSKRLTSLEKHFVSVHSKTSQDVYDQIHGPRPFCACGCGALTKWNGWKSGYSSVVNGHNGFIYKVNDEETAREISEKRRQKLMGKESWANGLTKETDERIKLRGEKTSIGRKKAFDEGRIKVWIDGLTRETDERVAAMGDKLHELHASGSIQSWCKGKTEADDVRLFEKNEALRMRYKTGELKVWLAGKTKEEDPRIAKIWLNRDSMKEYEDVRLSDEELHQRVSKNKVLEISNTDHYRNSNMNTLSVRCKLCGWEDDVKLYFACNDRCPKCSPAGSLGQNSIADWITSSGFDVGRNVKGIIGRHELDIFVPEKMMAIEFNGLYWHSEKQLGKTSMYHQRKTDMCRSIGINLIHVFEDEWRTKPEIVKSIITSKLGLLTRKIHARNCEIVELNSSTKRDFFNENHLDSDVNSEAAWGLSFDGEIVYALSVRRPFHSSKDGMIEVARCCPKINENVQGGLSRLVNIARTYAVEKSSKGLLTYVDTRLGGDGRGYLISGFTQSSITPPRFWWTDYKSRFNRFKYRADSKNGLTEKDVAAREGVVKIWGCRNIVYTLIV